jgi:FlgO protein
MLNKAIITILISTLLSGCGVNRFFDVHDADLIEVSNDAADVLREKATRSIPINSLILVSTLLNVNDLHETSAFGRIISDQIASSFHNSGYRIIGMEMPIDLFVMKEGGALHLSDEVKALLKPYNAAVMVGGVYAPGKRNTYVSLRVVDLFTKNIISSTDIAIPMGPDARKLLHSEKLVVVDGSPASPGPAPAEIEKASESPEVISPEAEAAPAKVESESKPAEETTADENQK